MALTVELNDLSSPGQEIKRQWQKKHLKNVFLKDIKAQSQRCAQKHDNF